MRIAFLGTPDFAVASLKMLVDSGYDVVGVFTQPDKPVGRSKKLQAPPTKILAQEFAIPVFQFNKIRSAEGVQALKGLDVDLMVTAAFGQILSQENLDIPKLGCINVHASLLPKYRGAAPIQWAIIQGEQKTGVTTMFTDIGLDTGDMLLKQEVAILPDETSGELFARMANIGAELLHKTLQQLLQNQLVRKKQDEAKATYFPMLKKEDGMIHWNQSAQKIHDFVRGMNPWPMAQTSLNGRKLNIYKVKPDDVETNINNQQAPGIVMENNPKIGLIVACRNSAVEILELQTQGGKPMSAKAFLLGNKINIGDQFE